MAHQTGEPRNSLILFIGLGSVIALTGIMYGLQSYYFYFRDGEQQAKILSRSNPELMEDRALEERTLSSYAMVESAKGRVRIPIDRAMALLAQRGRDGFESIRLAPSASGLVALPSASSASPVSRLPVSSSVPVSSASAGSSAAPMSQPGVK